MESCKGQKDLEKGIGTYISTCVLVKVAQAWHVKVEGARNLLGIGEDGIDVVIRSHDVRKGARLLLKSLSSINNACSLALALALALKLLFYSGGWWPRGF